MADNKNVVKKLIEHWQTTELNVRVKVSFESVFGKDRNAEQYQIAKLFQDNQASFTQEETDQITTAIKDRLLKELVAATKSFDIVEELKPQTDSAALRHVTEFTKIKVNYFERNKTSYQNKAKTSRDFKTSQDWLIELMRKLNLAEQPFSAETIYSLMIAGKYLNPKWLLKAVSSGLERPFMTLKTGDKHDSIYYYCQKHPDASQEFDKLKETVFDLIMLARQCSDEIEEPWSQKLTEYEFYRKQTYKDGLKDEVIQHLEATLAKKRINSEVNTSHLKPHKGSGGLL